MKRIFTGILAALVLTALLSGAALAAGDGQLVISNAAAARGSTVTLTVGLEGNPGIANITADLVYDHSVLELVSAEGIWTGGTWDIGDIAATDAIMWYAAENNTSSGNVMTLTFKVRDSAPVGAASVSLYFDPDWGGVFNDRDADALDIGVAAGTVNIMSAGDADGSGTIDTYDAALIVRYASGENVELDLPKADANGDDAVTVSDAALILRGIAS